MKGQLPGSSSFCFLTTPYRLFLIGVILTLLIYIAEKVTAGVGMPLGPDCRDQKMLCHPSYHLAWLMELITMFCLAQVSSAQRLQTPPAGLSPCSLEGHNDSAPKLAAEAQRGTGTALRVPGLPGLALRVGRFAGPHQIRYTYFPGVWQALRSQHYRLQCGGGVLWRGHQILTAARERCFAD